MLRKFTLQLSAFLLLASFGSSASACGLLPLLNPFAWVFGHGCGYGYGYNGCQPWCGSGCGSYGHQGGYGYQGGYQGYQRSLYTPSYPSMAPSAGCNCTPNAVAPTMAPATTGAAWPSSAMTVQASPWGALGGWSPQRQWTPPATAWQTQQFSTVGPTFAPPQTTMSTAPIYGPAYQIPASRVAGDIRGDHEFPVIPNGYTPAAGAPIHRVNYQPRRRPVRRYSQAIR